MAAPLKFIQGKWHSGYYENMVLQAAQELVEYYEVPTLAQFMASMKEQIEKIPRRSVGAAWCFYDVCFDSELREVQIHHKKVDGARDRLIATIKYNHQTNLILADVSGSNSFGEVTLNTSSDKDCCSQCKYGQHNGDHDACFTCAYEDIGSNCYYR